MEDHRCEESGGGQCAVGVIGPPGDEDYKLVCDVHRDAALWPPAFEFTPFPEVPDSL